MHFFLLFLPSSLTHTHTHARTNAHINQQVGHTHYVTALTTATDTDTTTHRLISGCFDASLGVWDLSSAEMIQSLTGHTYQVTGLATTPNQTIVSSSADATLRLWSLSSPSPLPDAVLEGHESAVQCVIALPDSNVVVSGSSDKSIRMWSVPTPGSSGGKPACIATLPNAHDDTVRTLALFPNTGIVSGSHDMTLKLWTLQGEALKTFVGHTALVYSVAVCEHAQMIASGSEDNTARVWDAGSGECVQVIEHPGCVWAVAFLPNGDVVTGCADGVARVWTRDEERRGREGVVGGYAAALTAYKEAQQEKKKNTNGDDTNGGTGSAATLPEGLKIEDPSVLEAPGGKDGQIVIVREPGGAGVAYSWVASKGEWERIGEVVSGDDDVHDMQQQKRKWYDGQEWDCVFDVAMGDDAPALKLAMNYGENPYAVADRFLATNGLPTEFKEQIVQFILQNVDDVRGGAPGFVDPYTGASAYVPQSTTTAPTGVGAGPNVDPFTGGAAAPLAVVKHCPAKSFLLFDAMPPMQALVKKMKEFWGTTAPSSLPFDSLVESSEGGAGALNKATAMEMLPTLLQWPADKVFPGLDIARVLMLDATYAPLLSSPELAGPSVSEQAPDGTLGKALWNVLSSTEGKASTEEEQSRRRPSQQVALRCLCNAFGHPSFQQWVREQVGGVLVLVVPLASLPAQSSTKGIRLGLCTLLINIGLALNKLPGDELSGKCEVVAAAAAVLESCPSTDEEARYRALVALGTVLPEHSQIRGVGRQLGLLETVAQVQLESGGGAKVCEAASEVLTLLRL